MSYVILEKIERAPTGYISCRLADSQTNIEWNCETLLQYHETSNLNAQMLKLSMVKPNANMKVQSNPKYLDTYVWKNWKTMIQEMYI